jgi:hypothetical protein
VSWAGDGPMVTVIVRCDLVVGGPGCGPDAPNGLEFDWSRSPGCRLSRGQGPTRKVLAQRGGPGGVKLDAAGVRLGDKDGLDALVA